MYIPRTERILGTIKRFREISAKDDEAALSYLEFTAFAEEDELNKHYLAAQLAIKLLIKESAYKHLSVCLSASARAKRPDVLEELRNAYSRAFPDD